MDTENACARDLQKISELFRWLLTGMGWDRGGDKEEFQVWEQQVQKQIGEKEPSIAGKSQVVQDS